MSDFSFERPEQTLRSSSETPRNTTMVCMICQAVYVPSQAYAYLLHAPHLALESAFMSMCHFCFRCRRPACPACWDDVHAVCGACGLDAHLSFRASPPPLSGTLFPPVHPASETRVHTEFSGASARPPFICVAQGRFQSSTTAPAAPAKKRKLEGANMHTRISPSYADLAELETRPERHVRVLKRVKYTVNTLFIMILVIGVALVLAAEVSLNVNALLIRLLHVDIQAEIAYLWQLIKQHL